MYFGFRFSLVYRFRIRVSVSIGGRVRVRCWLGPGTQLDPTVLGVGIVLRAKHLLKWIYGFYICIGFSGGQGVTCWLLTNAAQVKFLVGVLTLAS